MKSLSIKFKAYSLLAIILFISLISSTIILWNLSLLNDDANIINAAGRQRMLTQAMSKAVFGYALSKEQEKKGNRKFNQELSIILKEYQQARKVFDETLNALRSGGKYPTNLQMTSFHSIPKIKNQSFREDATHVSKIFQSFQNTVQDIFTSSIGTSKFHHAELQLLKQSNLLRTASQKLVDDYVKITKSKQTFLRMTTIVSSIIIFAVICLVAFAYSQWIFSPIYEIIEFMEHLSKGKLDRQLPIKHKDEIGRLGVAINSFILKLRSVVETITKNSDTLSGSSNDLAALSKQILGNSEHMKDKVTTIMSTSEELSINVASVAESAEQTSVSVSSATLSVEEVSNNINTVAAAAEEASISVADINQNINHITNDIGKVSSSVDQISTDLKDINQQTKNAMDSSLSANQTSKTTLEQVKELGARATQVDKIVKLIENIASQTNMLALNATIEAASAGNAGKGFAVVASEVKGLAQETAEANNEIAQQVLLIQEQTQGVLDQTLKVSSAISDVAEINNTISKTVNQQSIIASDISGSVESVAFASKEVATTLEEASKGLQEITRSVAESSRAANSSAKNVLDGSKQVKEIATSSNNAATRVADVSQSVQEIYNVIQEVNTGILSVETNATALSQVATDLTEVISFFQINSSVLQLKN
ncbi:MAG: methyl-accepting chemotaxis protein [bacterium]|jgi:methyl-accepting chemotaxis protein